MNPRIALTIILAQLLVIALAIGGLIYALSRPAGVSFPLVPRPQSTVGPISDLPSPISAASVAARISTAVANGATARRSCASHSAVVPARGSLSGAAIRTGVCPPHSRQRNLPVGSLLQGADVFPMERASAGHGSCHGESNTANYSAHAAGREKICELNRPARA
jgi:hypothetical protein